MRKKKNSRSSGAGWEGTLVIKTRCLWRGPYVTDTDREAPASSRAEEKKERENITKTEDIVTVF